MKRTGSGSVVVESEPNKTPEKSTRRTKTRTKEECIDVSLGKFSI